MINYVDYFVLDYVDTALQNFCGNVYVDWLMLIVVGGWVGELVSLPCSH